MVPPAADAARLILVVDDEPLVLSFMEQTLAAAGYAVHTAPNALRALELVARLPRRPALMVSDIRMQPIDGPGLADLVLHTSPNTRVLFVSGYPADPNELGSSGRLLKKPFAPEQLVQAVAELVGAGAP